MSKDELRGLLDDLEMASSEYSLAFHEGYGDKLQEELNSLSSEIEQIKQKILENFQ